MSGWLVALVLEYFPARSPQELSIAVVYAEAADADGRNAYPSVARVAALARVSERTVQYAVKEFQTGARLGGFLVLQEAGGGRGRPARYRVDLAWLEKQRSVLESLRVGRHIPGEALVVQEQAGFLNRANSIHQERKYGAGAIGDPSRNGAAAVAPDPLPKLVNPMTTTTTNQHTGLPSEFMALNELIEAALWAAKRSPRGVRSEAGFRLKVRARITVYGASTEDLRTLMAWKAEKDRPRNNVAASKPPTAAELAASEIGRRVLRERGIFGPKYVAGDGHPTDDATSCAVRVVGTD